ncbi:YciI family protein [Ponticaulis koreensis]|uniref:YciI family protein n=1 Tax=Ponticaulis koreensis TaxID=1123045 RepID=UPI0003B5C3FC|nr:YciI family protein [Ponticaulis koreensis]
MPHFLIVARDFPGQLTRRLSVRAEHLALADKLTAEGKLLIAGATVGDDGAMTGSMMICEFENRDELDRWLEIEPYNVHKVWEHIEVSNFNIGPAFLK